VLLLDKRKNAVVNVADNLVNDAIGSGNYEFRPGVPIPVVLSDGSSGEVMSDNMPDAYKAGIRYRTSEQIRSSQQEQVAEIRKEAFDKPVTAAVLGALRSPTLGASDAAIRLLGGEQAAEAVRAVRDENPNASLAGEIFGGVASFATPAGPLGVVTKTLGAPIRAVTKAGEKVAQGLIKGSQQLTATQKMGRALVGGAVEGAAIGVGQTVSEMALADPELTTQKAIANIGLGMLFGGGLSATGRGLLEGGKVVSTSLLNHAAKTELITQPASVVAAKLGKLYGAASGAVKQIDDPVWTKLWDEGSVDFRKSALDALNNPRGVVDDVAKQFDGIKSFSNDLRTVANEGANLQGRILDAQVGRAPKKTLDLLDDDEALEFGVDAILSDRVVKGPKLVQAEKEAGFEVFDRIQQAGKNLVQKGDDLLTKMRAANETERSFGRSAMYDDATIRDFASRVEDFSKSTTAATKPSEVAKAMTAFKNETAELFKIPKGKTLDIIKTDNRPLWETAKELRDYWKGVKEATVSKDIFGDLGSAMAVRADAISNVISATDSLMSKFYRIKPGKTMNTREYVPDVAKINSFIVNPDAARNAIRSEAVDEIKVKVRDAISVLKPIDIKSSQDDLKRLETLLVKTERIPANKKSSVNKEEKITFLQGKIKDLSKQIDEARQFNANIETFKASAAKRVDSFESAFDIAREKRAAVLLVNRLESTTGRSLMGGIAGGALSQTAQLLGVDPGPVGTAAGILGGLALTNPKAALRYLSAMENAATGFDKMAQNAAAKFVRFDKKLGGKEGIIGKAAPAIRQSIIREKLKLEPQERPQDDETAFKAHRKKLTQLQQNPEALLMRVAENMGDDAMNSPRLAIETQAAVMRGLSFLESKIPKDPYNPGVYPDDFVPSPVEMSHYGDYVQAVMKPKIILKQMADGNINPRTVEAIKAVYPKLYDDLLTQVTGQLMKPEKASFQARVQLGILFGIPSVKAMQPDYLARMAQLKQPQQAQQQQPQGNMAALNASNREQRV